MTQKAFTNKYAILIGLLMFAVLAFGHFGFPQFNTAKAAEVTPGEGLLLYGDGTELSSASYCTLSNGCGSGNSRFGTLSSASAGTISPLWVKVASSPTKKEALAASLDTSGKLEVQRWNGKNWVLEWAENSVGSSSLDTRAFDLAYESNGDAIVAWGKTKGAQDGAAADDLQFRVYASGSWVASSSFNLTKTIASISWVEMAPHPASGSSQTEITMCYTTGRSAAKTGFHAADTAVACLVWDGVTNQWGNEKLIESDAGENGTAWGSMKNMSVFYEQGSGQAVALAGIESAGNSNAVGIIYATWDPSGGWAATAGFNIIGGATSDAGDTISCSPKPYKNNSINNRGVCGTYTAGSVDTDGFVWSGSAFLTGANLDTAANTAANAQMSTASGWLIASSSYAGIVVAGSADSTDLDHHASTSSATWATPTAFSHSTGNDNNYFMVMNPHQKEKAIVFLVDSNSDLFAYQASLGGLTINWRTLNGGGAITNDLAVANGLPVGFDFLRYASPSQKHFRWYNDDGNLGSATSISAEDTAASGSEDLTINSTYRLRFQVSNEGPASASNNKFRLEMVRMGASCLAPSTGWSWVEVPVTATVASEAFDIEATTHFANNASTSAALLTASDPTFTNGYAMDTSNTSGFQSLHGNNYTEFEYAIKPNSNANTAADYCFRLRRLNGGGATAPASISYDVYAQAGVQAQASTTLAQNDFRWFNNDNSVQPGSALAGENTRYQMVSTNQTTPVRLRMNVNVTSGTLAANSLSLNLQYANTNLSSPSYQWIDAGDVTGDAWCNISDDCTASWLNRKKIIFNNSASTENLTNFPVLIALSGGTIDYGKTKNSGQDIRFVDAGGTASLSYEIEKWDESGTSYVWVKVPQIDSGSTTDYIWIYYNNTSASDGQNATNVWDSNFKGVWHMHNASSPATDSKAAQSASQNGGVTFGATGKVNSAVSFAGDNDYLDAGDTTSLDGATAATFSFWTNLRTLGTSRRFLGKWADPSGYTFVISEDDTNSDEIIIGVGGGSLIDAVSTTDANLTTDTWYYVTATWTDSTRNIYVNGSAKTLGTPFDQGVGAIGNTTTTLQFGHTESGIYFDGFLDEVRISDNVRSAEWIEAEYNWMNSPSSYNTFGSEEGVGAKDWQFYNNSSATDGAAINTNLLTVSDVVGRYAESNPTTATHNEVSTGQDIEFDFSLDPSAVNANVLYYFRVVKSDGTALDAYNDYPSLIITSPTAFVPTPEAVSGGGSMRSGGGASGSSGSSEGGSSGGGTPTEGGGQTGGGGQSPILWYILEWLRQQY